MFFNYCINGTQSLFFREIVENILSFFSVLRIKTYFCLAILTLKNRMVMKELIEKAAALYADFTKDADLQLNKGNKAAGTRARKASLDLEKLMKEFRKASLEASKQ